MRRAGKFLGTRLGRLVLLAVLLALVVGPVYWPTIGRKGESTDSGRILRYDATFDIDRQGDLTVVETLTFDFGADRHGIFRLFDRSDKTSPRLRHEPQIVSVLRDGKPEPYKVLSSGRGRYTNLKIGDPDVLRKGGTYTITYKVDGVLTEGDSARSVWRWKLIPSAWPQPIDQATLRVTLPVPITAMTCRVGGTDTCRVTGGGRSRTIEASDLAANTNVAVEAGIDLATPPPGTELLWPVTFDRVLGRSTAGAAAILLGAVLAGAVGLFGVRRSREKAPPAQPAVTPPAGIGPAEGAFLLHERCGHAELVASLVHAAQAGAISMQPDQRDPKAWWIDKGPRWDSAWKTLDPSTREVRGLVAHSALVVGPGYTTGGEALKRLTATQAAAVEKAAVDRGWVNKSNGMGVFPLLLGLLLFGVYWTLQANTLPTSLALIPGVLFVAALPLGFRTARTRRTEAGRAMWAQLEGFADHLRTCPPAPQDPNAGWTIALLGTKPPISVPKSSGQGRTDEMDPMLDRRSFAGSRSFYDAAGSFESAVSGAISSYESASGSSDSGSSDSGGGGDGGGGTW